MDEQEQFLKLKEPRAPWRDWRTYSMLGPIMSGALGACIFFALGLAFAEIINIGPGWRKFLVLTASFTVAFGATFGSVGSGIEVFRKSYKGQATAWDWASLTISIVTTVVGMVMGFAALLGATEEWSRIATIYGCIVVGGFASLDAGGDMIELGGLFGSYEDRYEAWLAEREEWRRENGDRLATNEKDREKMEKDVADLETMMADLVKAVAALENRLHHEIEKLNWPVARLGDFEAIRAAMNGDGDQMTVEQLEVELDQRQMRMPSAQTVARWLS